ncbi:MULTISPECIES: hypothetical protein [Silvimonas]|uniref:hypothetical protein n=1 Tax=Silvimonas TaxID=300264 RepID=UPI0024B3557F|nr:MULTISPECIES: hypothetical protein [Silvimonas]MDR3426922.1 hypothetical protein [Silvimonas sp.]
MFTYKIAYRAQQDDEKIIIRQLDGDLGESLDAAILLLVILEAFPDERSLGSPSGVVENAPASGEETIGDAMARYGIESIMIKHLKTGTRRSIAKEQLFRP